MKSALRVSEQNLTLQKIREYLHYNTETGILTWIKKPHINILIGARAGSLKQNGYRYIRIDNFECLEHRLIWFGVTGEWPSKEFNIDHIDGNKSNNSWNNLRKVSVSENALNVKARKSNSLSLRGIRVRQDGKGYVARIMVNKKEYHVGSFSTLEEALAARNAKAVELGLTTYKHDS